MERPSEDGEQEGGTKRYNTDETRSRVNSYKDTGKDGREHKRRKHSPEDADHHRRRSRSRSQERGSYDRREYRRRSREPRRRRSPSSEHASNQQRRRRRSSVSSHDYDRDHLRARRRDDRQLDTARPRDSRQRSPSPRAHQRRGPLPPQAASFAVERGSPPPLEKEKPNYEPTGLLAKEANTVQVSNHKSGSSTAATNSRARNVVLKYHEPPEARRPPPSQAWRLYRFTASGGKEPVDTIALGERSCWLFGREAGVVDVLLEHDTCGKQHAVVQFRHSVARDEYGDKHERVRPYVIDLESKGGTRLDGRRVDPGRYVELRDGDVLRFGREDGEWVVMLPPAE